MDPFCALRPEFFVTDNAFHKRISSQLLLYRLCTLFGMPQAVGDAASAYKVCWEARLRYKGADDQSLPVVDPGHEEGTPANQRVVGSGPMPPPPYNYGPGENMVGYLSFSDWKGGPSVHFNGCKEYSDHALELLNFIVGPVCPHPYDGVIAGRQA
jgi:hypothetical protein